MIVTTTHQPTATQETRAAAVASKTGWTVVPRRRSVQRMLVAHGVPVAYVVGRVREELVTEGQRVAVDLGLLHAHRSVGERHPLIASLGLVSRVVDGTCGLCRDALHVASVTGAQVVGLEVAAPLVCLAEEGLPRLARDEPAAARVSVELADSRERLASIEADAVMLSPMFDEPQAAAPGFDVLRGLAKSQPLDREWLDAAFTAAPRVVVKVRPRQPVPSFARSYLVQVRHGRAVDYWNLQRKGRRSPIGEA